ncbi:hypothetical protein [uncultured Gimesia sp.]|uniref:hypothetical protein n=1 Tax=uncultured Gimesia sp. TaxID=1678688 RepID=UPI00263131A3|nr:hypothetical protein [uncultured Gimesia sp.]
MRFLTTLFTLLAWQTTGFADLKLLIELPRSTYWRGETIHAKATCTNDSAKSVPSTVLRLTCQEWAATTADVPALKAQETTTVELTLSTKYLKSGADYQLITRLFEDIGANQPQAISLKPLAEHQAHFALIRRPNSERLDVWQWVYGGPVDIIHAKSKLKAKDLGFTVAGGPVFPYSSPKVAPRKQLQSYRRSLEATMKRGMDISFSPVGLWHREFNLIPPKGSKPLVEEKSDNSKTKHRIAAPDDDTRYKGAGRNGQEYFNPFHPEVERQQDRANEMMMDVLGDFPNLKYAFIDAEFVDDLYYHNTNVAGLKKMQRMLGFTKEEIGPAKYVAKGVLADDDRGLRYRRYSYQHGNGINHTLKRAANTVHQQRPDVQFLSDPYRSVALLDMFPNCDLISTWTYTNPDPKLMLYIETLRAVCRPSGQEPLHVVTLLNYPGSVVPEAHDKNWIMMGPGRLRETTWINLSRAPKVIGYYAFDGYYHSDLSFSPESMQALTDLSQKVFKPFGPMIRKLNVAPRNIAVLSSESSRLYNKSTGLLGYPNYQPYHFYTVMAMAHLNADVVFDETIERFGLDQYDVLVLPKCDVLTKTVYDQILNFQKRGGIVISDQYLGAEIPNVIRFDFDFTHRRKVSANAIATGKIYVGTGQDDHILPGKSAMEKVQGVTAKQDQLLLESYAKQLRTKLSGIVQPDIWCDQYDVLINVLEKNGVKYLVVINDKRTYDDRTGPFKAVMEKLIPQKATIRVKRDSFPPGTTPYDLLASQKLSISQKDDVIEFSVDLGKTGGTIIALAPQNIQGIAVEAPQWIRQNTENQFRVRIVNADKTATRGLQPLQILVTDPDGKDSEYSHHACAEEGYYEFNLPAAANDAIGNWKLTVKDLTSRSMATHEFEVRKN